MMVIVMLSVCCAVVHATGSFLRDAHKVELDKVATFEGPTCRAGDGRDDEYQATSIGAGSGSLAEPMSILPQEGGGGT